MEIKKFLYKNKQMASFVMIRKGVAHYATTINDNAVRFEVPVEDMGDADFGPQMEAQHLLRWLV